MRKSLLAWIFIIALLVVFFGPFGLNEASDDKPTEISFSDFLSRVESGEFKEVRVTNQTIEAEIPKIIDKEDEKAKPEKAAKSETPAEKSLPFLSLSPAKQKTSRYFAYSLLTEESVKKLLTSKADIKILPPKDDGISFFMVLQLISSVLFILVLVMIFMNLKNSGGMGGIMRPKKSALNPDGRKVTFNDVAGIEEAKADVAEIVEFLRDPKRFDRLGGRIPKGVLLVGPPGTGKTLLARAIAGEAGVPFLSMSGSDFVEMFVGVGASRVRELFDDAKKMAPCIIFIDEIDSIGGRRTNEYGGGREYAQTLNQLLTEMDGFSTNEGVIVIAATNRADILDEALLRPGRFDRRVTIDLPDLAGREAILKLHLKRIKASSNVDPRYIARGTPGFSGAELDSLVNEAALIAARQNKITVTSKDFDEARDKILMGAERRSRTMSKEEISNTAHHEAGHAICALKSPSVDPIHKATIIPRGRALGMVQQMAENDSVSETLEKIKSTLVVFMGGRAAEEIFAGKNKITTGASSDIRAATYIAGQAIRSGGLSDKLGLVSYKGSDYYDEMRISDDTKKKIDDEIKSWIDTAYAEAKRIIKKYKKETIAIAKALIEYETITGDEIKAIAAGKKIKRELEKLPPVMSSSLPITSKKKKAEA